MALELTPLDGKALPDSVARVIAPGPMQAMAARGMAPLAPTDLATALYMLATPWAAEGPQEPSLSPVVVDARRTAAELPDGVLVGAMSASLDPRVFDFFARKAATRPKVVQAMLFNRAVGDETFAYLASVVGEAEVSAIARNEERLLRHPPIIAALYLNPKTPMSMAIRAVELAIRNGVVVEGIPGYDDLKAELEKGSAKKVLEGAEDHAFREAQVEGELLAAESGEAPPEVYDPDLLDGEVDQIEQGGNEDRSIKIDKLSVPAKIRLATVGNAFHRSQLVRDSVRLVALAAISSPQVGDNEVAKYAGNRGLSEDVIRYIAKQRHFTRLNSVKMALLMNPKTPLASSIGFLNFLNVKEVRVVARSKSIPGALVKAAQGLLSKKQK